MERSTLERELLDHGGLILGRTTRRHDRQSAGFVRFDVQPEMEEEWLTDKDEGHLLTIAPTGAGKGTSQVIPALLSWKGPAIVVDVKGENFHVTARRRREMGQDVILLDPFKVTGAESHGFNPLDAIDPYGDDVLGGCAELAARIAVDRSHLDAFWDDRARQTLTAFIAYVLMESPKPHRNLSEVRYLLNQSDKNLELTLESMENSKADFVAQSHAVLSTAEAKVRASIVSTAQRSVEIFRHTSVARSMDRTDFDLEAIRDGKPMTIYIVIPPYRLHDAAPLLRLWIGSLLGLIAHRTALPEIPALLLLDEAAQLGRLQEFLTAITLMRGYGIKVWSFWQDIEQIEQCYPGCSRTILNNCTTVTGFGFTTPFARNGFADMFGMPEAELARLGKEQAVLFKAGQEWQFMERTDYRTTEVFKSLFDPNPRHLKPVTKDKPKRCVGDLERAA